MRISIQLRSGLAILRRADPARAASVGRVRPAVARRTHARLHAPAARTAHDGRESGRRCGCRIWCSISRTWITAWPPCPFAGSRERPAHRAATSSCFAATTTSVRELDRRVTHAFGFGGALAVTGQTYSRKLDARVLAIVAGITASAAKFSGDIRMLQAFGEIEEPFEAEQVGSSAMAYKRNPMRSERIAGTGAIRAISRSQRQPDAQCAVFRADAR